mgnify:CR=1 FL=1
MTTRYVGIGGNDSNDGLSWANRKLTLNGVEDTPVEAGDTVYVGAGTYRELLTCDVDGSSGSPITYIGDYDGSHTDGTGGVVRITGSDDDLSATRAQCVNVNQKDYRTFKNFTMDMASTALIYYAGDYDIYENLYLVNSTNCITFVSASTYQTVRNCYIEAYNGTCVYYHSAGVDIDTHSVIENCILKTLNRAYAIIMNRCSNSMVRNCIINAYIGILVQNFSDSYDNNVAYNNIFIGCYNAIIGVATTYGITEDYNTFYSCNTPRSNCDVGAHSVTTPPLFDTRWFFELVSGGSILSPFDLASYSKLIDVAGTSPTTADMRGTTVQGTQREWGALEYDSTLDIEAGSGSGGAVTISPIQGEVSL